MATSNSFNFATTRTGIIESALRKLGVLAEGQSASATQLTNGAESLNFMLKAWAADGMPLWAMKYVYVYPIADTNEVNISNVGGAGHASLELITTATTAAAVITATTIVVSTSGTGVTGTTANSDQLGIELDNGTIQWTTISSGGGTTSLVIADQLTAAVASGNRVYAYTTKAERPIQVLDAWCVDPLSSARTPVNIYAERDLKNFGNLTSESDHIVAISYVGGDYDSRLTFYPRWQSGSTYLELRVQYPHEDMDGATDEPAFPAEMWEAVVWQLALRLIPEYGVSGEQAQFVGQMAITLKAVADGFIREQSSLFFQPERR